MADCEAIADFKKACPLVSQEQCLSCSDAKITESDCEENRHRWSLCVGAKKERRKTQKQKTTTTNVLLHGNLYQIICFLETVHG